MTKKIAFLFIGILILLFLGCSTAPFAHSGIWVTGISESVTRYYIPATTWQEKNNRSITCRIDLTYVDEPNNPVVCNISFFNSNSIPKEVASISFTTDSKRYHLNDISIMFSRVEYNELRITSTIKIEDILNLFQCEKISLRAVIDSVEYTFYPNEDFLYYSEQLKNYLL